MFGIRSVLANIRDVIKNHLYHLILVVSILSLTSLLAWWSIFISQAIEKQRTFRLKNLELSLDLIFTKEKTGLVTLPYKGVFEKDPNFEVIDGGYSGDIRYQRLLTSTRSKRILRIRPEIIDSINNEYKNKRFMLLGESGFLCFLILLSCLFLYRYIRLEKRAIVEVRKFWERVTHELKTPLTGIKSFLDTLNEQNLNTSELVSLRDQALILVETHQNQVENILAVSYHKKRIAHFKLGDINISQWIAKYLTHSALHLKDVKVNLNVKNNNDLFVLANAGALRIIMDIITNNTVKHCPSPVHLSIDLYPVRKKIHLVLKDNGPGFDAKFAAKIFKIHSDLDGKQPPGHQGSGMGLYMAKEVAQKMGAKLTASSEGRGCGAQFLLALRRSKKYGLQDCCC
jgi:signal transduction histidine kinase